MIWLESLIAVGCTFGPCDLSAEEWDGVLTLASARAQKRKKPEPPAWMKDCKLQI